MLSDEEIEERLAGRRWVFAYDPVTGERVGFTSCPERRVPATRMLYEMDGYRVEVMTVGEVDEMVGRRLRRGTAPPPSRRPGAADSGCGSAAP